MKVNPSAEQVASIRETLKEVEKGVHEAWVSFGAPELRTGVINGSIEAEVAIEALLETQGELKGVIDQITALAEKLPKKEVTGTPLPDADNYDLRLIVRRALEDLKRHGISTYEQLAGVTSQQFEHMGISPSSLKWLKQIYVERGIPDDAKIKGSN